MSTSCLFIYFPVYLKSATINKENFFFYICLLLVSNSVYKLDHSWKDFPMVDIASFRVGIFPSESSKFSPWFRLWLFFRGLKIFQNTQCRHNLRFKWGFVMVILIFKAITPSIFIRLSISVFQDLSILFSDQPCGMWQEMCPKVKKGTFMHF